MTVQGNVLLNVINGFLARFKPLGYVTPMGLYNNIFFYLALAYAASNTVDLNENLEAIFKIMFINIAIDLI